MAKDTHTPITAVRIPIALKDAASEKAKTEGSNLSAKIVELLTLYVGV
jgi:hypothetical protein